MSKKNARENILKTAEELFCKYGFKRVNIEEICKKANVSRKTFYVYFPNKTELVIEIIKNVYDIINKKFVDIMESEDSFMNKMNYFLIFKIESAKYLSMEFADDIFNANIQEITDYYQKIINESAELTYHYFKIAQKNGELRNDIELEVIIYISNLMTDMCNDQKLQSMFSSFGEMVKQVTKIYLYGIIAR